MPGAPPLLSTRFSAADRFSRSHTCSHSSTSDFPSSRAGDGSALCSVLRKLHFPPLLSSPLIQGFLPSSFIPQAAQSTHPFLMFGPSPRDGSGTMASADSCSLSLVSRPGLPFLGPGNRSPQVRTLTFPASLPHLLLWLLVASGFIVIANSPSLTASYWVRVPQVAGLPPASSGPHLAVTPLPSANGCCNQPP